MARYQFSRGISSTASIKDDTYPFFPVSVKIAIQDVPKNAILHFNHYFFKIALVTSKMTSWLERMIS